MFAFENFLTAGMYIYMALFSLVMVKVLYIPGEPFQVNGVGAGKPKVKADEIKDVKAFNKECLRACRWMIGSWVLAGAVSLFNVKVGAVFMVIAFVLFCLVFTVIFKRIYKKYKI